MNKRTIAIYANCGTFDSIKEAAFSEHRIDWMDMNNRLCNYCTESFAAYKLYTHLQEAGIEHVRLVDDIKEIKSADTAIVIISKETSREALSFLGISENIPFPKELTSPDGYRIQNIQDQKVILLSANSRIGTLYAVYHYLKLQGFSFISPDLYGFITPVLEDLKDIPEVILEQPDYITRGSRSEYSDDENKLFFEWMIANRLNYMTLKGIHDYPYIKKWGIKLCGGGHAALYEYLPADKAYPHTKDSISGNAPTYFDVHPEWFALIDGKRQAGVDKEAQALGYYTGNNFCTSNEEAVQEFCNNYVQSLIDGKMKYLDIIDLWPLDNGKWCQCDHCKETGNYSRRILMLAYSMMKTIKKAIHDGLLKRDITIFVPAYHETLPEPDRPLPDDFDYDMCKVTLFTIERCYVHDLFDKNCTEANTILADHIREWTTKKDRNYKGELVIGEYFNVSSFVSIPVVLADRISRDIPAYYEIGARHFDFMHMITENWGAKIINYNLYPQLLWNVKTDAKQFLSDLLSAFYLSESGEMENIYKMVEKALENCKYIFHYQFVNGKITSLRNNIKTQKPFVSKHVQYDYIPNDKNAGLDFLSGLALLDEAKDKVTELIDHNDRPVLRERLSQLQTHLQFGIELYTFYKLLLEYFNAYHKEDKEICKKIAKELYTLNEECVSYKWVLKGYKYELMFFDSLASASWQKQLYESIIKEADIENASAELSL